MKPDDVKIPKSNQIKNPIKKEPKQKPKLLNKVTQKQKKEIIPQKPKVKKEKNS